LPIHGMDRGTDSWVYPGATVPAKHPFGWLAIEMTSSKGLRWHAQPAVAEPTPPVLHVTASTFGLPDPLPQGTLQPTGRYAVCVRPQ
jgi:hypothetical protein